jgi:hypothetical protein
MSEMRPHVVVRLEGENAPAKGSSINGAGMRKTPTSACEQVCIPIANRLNPTEQPKPTAAQLTLGESKRRLCTIAIFFVHNMWRSL